MLNKEKTQLHTLKRVLLLITFLFTLNTVFAQKALKILKDDGSTIYINASAVDKITFETPLAIGDTYQGGLIFYLDDNGEHGLVMAPSDQSNGIHWYNGSYTYTGTSGGGMENTYKIIGSQGNEGSYAAKLCADLTLEGYSDWYLPSKHELNLMYLHLSWSFYHAYYWTSSESGHATAWCQHFEDGYQGSHTGKYVLLHVRAIRAF